MYVITVINYGTCEIGDWKTLSCIELRFVTFVTELVSIKRKRYKKDRFCDMVFNKDKDKSKKDKYKKNYF